MADILVYALHYEGAINKNSLGAVSEGARLAGELGGERPILGDSAISEIKYRSPVGIVIGRLNAFEARQDGAGPAAVEQLSYELSSHAGRAKMLVRGEQRGADVDIEGADVLIA